ARPGEPWRSSFHRPRRPIRALKGPLCLLSAFGGVDIDYLPCLTGRNARSANLAVDSVRGIANCNSMVRRCGLFRQRVLADVPEWLGARRRFCTRSGPFTIAGSWRQQRKAPPETKVRPQRASRQPGPLERAFRSPPLQITEK